MSYYVRFIFLITCCSPAAYLGGQSILPLDSCGVSYVDPQDTGGGGAPSLDTLLYTQNFSDLNRLWAFYIDINAFGGQQVDRARVEAVLPDGSVKPLGSLAFGSCADCVEGFAFVHEDSLLVQGVTDPDIMMLWLESLNQPDYALPGNLQTLSGVGRISGFIPPCATGWRVEYVVFSNPASTSTEFSTHILCPEEVALCDLAVTAEPDCQQDSLFLAVTFPDGCFSDPVSITWTTPQGAVLSGTEQALALTGNLGWHYLQVQDECCTLLDSVLVENPPFAEAGPDRLFCAGTTVELAGSGGSGHFWEGPGGSVFADSVLLLSEVQPDQSGPYVLHAFNQEGCEDTDTLILTVPEPVLPQVVLPEACLGDTLLLSLANDTAFTQVSWFDPAGAAAAPLIPGFQPADFGTYSVRAIDLLGCETTATFEVTGSEPPAFEFFFERTCDSTVVFLMPDTYQYTWETGDTGSPFTSLTGGRYALTVTDEAGCSTVSQIDVPAPARPQVTLEVQQPLCPGDGGFIGMEPLDFGQPLIFSIDGGDSYRLNNEFDDLPPGLYSLRVQDDLGCIQAFEVEIITPDTMGVRLPDERLEVRPGTPVTVTAETAGNIQYYQWLPGEINTGGPVTAFIADRDLDIRLIVEDDRGCRASARLPLTIVLGEIYVPNAFSPNNDGRNDRFTFYSDGGSGEIIESLRVFDRWGGLLFETEEIPLNDNSLGWDGRRGNKPLLPGVYTYHGVVRFGNGARRSFSGEINLLR